MMTKQQHIEFWINSSEEDWLSVDVLFEKKRYLHGLFWAHLTLEKLSKALWIKHHKDDTPPRIHNIVWLLEESKVDLGQERMAFLIKFNRFQLSTRYPDYMNKMYKICTSSFATEILETANEIRICLLEMLQ